MYILDTNVFIQAKNFYYGFDIVPAFWDWLDEKFEDDEIVSIKPVYDELVAGKDDLAEWAKDRKDSGWFIDVDDIETQMKFAEISRWTVASDFKGPAKTEFLCVADSLLVAKAMERGATIVTHESLYDPNIKKKIKIPNVCEKFGVQYKSTFELMRILGARF
ncbi:MAG: DUF4411 family protein [Sulfurovum sp.]|nr:DUF4411 family protein [Sulfurovum sp.]